MVHFILTISKHPIIWSLSQLINHFPPILWNFVHHFLPFTVKESLYLLTTYAIPSFLPQIIHEYISVTGILTNVCPECVWQSQALLVQCHHYKSKDKTLLIMKSNSPCKLLTLLWKQTNLIIHTHLLILIGLLNLQIIQNNIIWPW